jgi:hypothetical protein
VAAALDIGKKKIVVALLGINIGNLKLYNFNFDENAAVLMLLSII